MNKKALLIIAAACMFSGAALACENPPCGPAKASLDTIVTGKTVKKTTKATPAQPAAEKMMLACEAQPCDAKASPDEVTGKTTKRGAHSTSKRAVTIADCDGGPCNVKPVAPSEKTILACDTPPCSGAPTVATKKKAGKVKTKHDVS